MPFHFQCPNGHLLEAMESQAGDECNCPHCGVLILIPQPEDMESETPDEPPGEVIPDVTGKPKVGSDPIDATKPNDDDLLHIPCPNGHLLDTPRDMLDQEVMCPHCDAQFLLRETDSEEYQRRRAQQLEARDAKIGKLWLNFAIVTGVLVLLGLFLLIWLASNNQTPP